jgi:hypothetical protein
MQARKEWGTFKKDAQLNAQIKRIGKNGGQIARPPELGVLWSGDREGESAADVAEPARQY